MIEKNIEIGLRNRNQIIQKLGSLKRYIKKENRPNDMMLRGKIWALEWVLQVPKKDRYIKNVDTTERK